MLFIVKEYLEREWGGKFEGYDDGRFDDISEGVVFTKITREQLILD